jgi:hypothetical protein
MKNDPRNTRNITNTIFVFVRVVSGIVISPWDIEAKRRLYGKYLVDKLTSPVLPGFQLTVSAIFTL